MGGLVNDLGHVQLLRNHNQVSNIHSAQERAYEEYERTEDPSSYSAKVHRGQSRLGESRCLVANRGPRPVREVTWTSISPLI